MKYLIILFLLISPFVFADDYLGETWHISHGTGGVQEYVIDTSACLSGDIGLYILDNNLTYKKFVYTKHNPKGKIIKYETSDNLDDIIKKQNDNAVSNKKMKKFEYKGGKKSFNEKWNNWKQAKDL